MRSKLANTTLQYSWTKSRRSRRNCRKRHAEMQYSWTKRRRSWRSSRKGWRSGRQSRKKWLRSWRSRRSPTLSLHCEQDTLSQNWCVEIWAGALIVRLNLRLWGMIICTPKLSLSLFLSLGLPLSPWRTRSQGDRSPFTGRRASNPRHGTKGHSYDDSFIPLGYWSTYRIR